MILWYQFLAWLLSTQDRICPVTKQFHDYPDGTIQEPMHFYTYTCRWCGGEFAI